MRVSPRGMGETALGFYFAESENVMNNEHRDVQCFKESSWVSVVFVVSTVIWTLIWTLALILSLGIFALLLAFIVLAGFLYVRSTAIRKVVIYNNETIEFVSKVKTITIPIESILSINESWNHRCEIKYRGGSLLVPWSKGASFSTFRDMDKVINVICMQNKDVKVITRWDWRW